MHVVRQHALLVQAVDRRALALQQYYQRDRGDCSLHEQFLELVSLRWVSDVQLVLALEVGGALCRRAERALLPTEQGSADRQYGQGKRSPVVSISAAPALPDIVSDEENDEEGADEQRHGQQAAILLHIHTSCTVCSTVHLSDQLPREFSHVARSGDLEV